MNIFEEIEGLDGENLVTALFRVLLLRSEEIRQTVIELISKDASFGPIAIDSHFSCVLEQSTREDASSGSGRLDLMIETDDAVIGVENKLFAGFQQGQPHKYLQATRERAEQLAKLREGQYNYYVVVIAPQSRGDEIQKHIADDNHLIFLKWETVLNEISSRSAEYDTLTAAITKSFAEYVTDRVAFIPKFNKWVPHLQRAFEPHGTILQRRVIAELKPMLPGPGVRLGSGKDWVGYYLCVGLLDRYGWFGFVNSRVAISSGANRASELIVVTSFPLSLPTTDFRTVRLHNSRFLYNKPLDLHAWAINYDVSWHDADRWRRAFEPLNEQTRMTALPAGNEI
ncbi:MAG: PD-(D/E)XK nuclease family protein [Steroidobacteraceae bacterium]